MITFSVFFFSVPPVWVYYHNSTADGNLCLKYRIGLWLFVICFFSSSSYLWIPCGARALTKFHCSIRLNSLENRLFLSSFQIEEIVKCFWDKIIVCQTRCTQTNRGGNSGRGNGVKNQFDTKFFSTTTKNHYKSFVDDFIELYNFLIDEQKLLCNRIWFVLNEEKKLAHWKEGKKAMQMMFEKKKKKKKPAII